MRRLFAVLLTIGFILPASLAIAQTPSNVNVPEFPSYTQWGKPIDTQQYSVILNGKDIQLSANVYQSLDEATLKRQIVNVLNNEQNNPWLARYLKTVYELNPDGRFSVKEYHLYLFENKKGEWIFIGEFSDNQGNQNMMNLLKEKYKLEFIS